MSSVAYTKPASQRGRFGVMVSSTYTDLRELRQLVIDAAIGAKLFPEAMEYDGALTSDLLESSLSKVRDASAYVLIIGHRYGQQPRCDRNPDLRSITELEYDEACRLDLPIILIVLGEDYQLAPRHVDRDSELKQRLDSFRSRAKLMGTDGLHRVYAEVNSHDDFRRVAERSLQALAQTLKAKIEDPRNPPTAAGRGPIALPPLPPAIHAVPAYIGSHRFVGRSAELDQLDDWSNSENTNPMLLFDAIGGSGKSMLTWHWFSTRALTRASDWAGRFWYSFYETGASMIDCCIHVLSYIDHRPLSDFKDLPRHMLATELILRLRQQAWLLVLDGLERVLVAYNRSDAATIADEGLESPSDQLADRNPCASAQREDDELLRQLASVAPSKILVTTRLVPRAILNAAHQPIPGVQREGLRGLKPYDAARLMQSTGVRGDIDEMQRYLESHCAGHPLVVGALAGLIADFVAAPCDFKRWEQHPDGGGALNLAELDLVQKRNHILHAALAALSPPERNLLATLALLPGGADGETIEALNPHRPEDPEDLVVPEDPESSWMWSVANDEQRDERRRQYVAARGQYEKARSAWLALPELVSASRQLATTLRTLRRRGLLQTGDGTQPHYDLHPVVRGFVSGNLQDRETTNLGQRIVDHYSQRPHNPYEQVECLQDLAGGFHIVRTLLRMGRFEQALSVWRGKLCSTALFNVQAHGECLALLKPFFPHGWMAGSIGLTESGESYLLTVVAVALEKFSVDDQVIELHSATIRLDAKRRDVDDLCTGLSNLQSTFRRLGRMADAYTCCALELRAAALKGAGVALFRARLSAFTDASIRGNWVHAKEIWSSLDVMGRDWPHGQYRPGYAEYVLAVNLWAQQQSPQQKLDEAESLARAGKTREVLRSVLNLRGQWRLLDGDAAAAIGALRESMQLARASGPSDLIAEGWLALARHQAGELLDLRAEAERIPACGAGLWPIARLWHAAGEVTLARKQALAYFCWAWADGEPFVSRFHLDRASALLLELGERIPDLPPYDPTLHRRLAWQDEVEAALDELETDRAKAGAGRIFLQRK